MYSSISKPWKGYVIEQGLAWKINHTAARWCGGLTLSPHRKKFPSSNLSWGLSVWGLHVLVARVWAFWLPPTVREHGK